MIARHRWLPGLALITALGAAPAPPAPGLAPGLPPGSPPGLPIVLAAQPGTPLDQTARTLLADDLAEAARQGDEPLLLVGAVRLGGATDRPVLFVQLQSPRQCGSSGCATSAYAWLKGKGGSRWAKVLDSVGGQIALASTKHRGMSDLVAGAERYAWSGAAYVNTRPAPAVDLRPRTPK